MQGVLSWSDDADESSACNYQAVEKSITSCAQHSVVDDLAMRFSDCQTLQCRKQSGRGAAGEGVCERGQQRLGAL